jgi:hypothetical protein
MVQPDLNRFLWTYVPVYKSLRIPPRHLIIFIFSASLIASYGLSTIPKRSLTWVLTVLIVIELTVFSRHFIASDIMPDLLHDRNIQSMLEPKDGLFRYFPNYIYTQRYGFVVDFNDPMIYRTYSVSGYQSLLLKNYYDLMTATYVYYNKYETVGIGQAPVMTSYRPDAIDLLNVRYLIESGDMLYVAPELRKYYPVRIDNTNKFVKVLENPTYMPRFYFPEQIVFLPTRQEIEQAIHNRSENLKTTLYLVSPEGNRKRIDLSCADGNPLPVKLQSYSLSDIVLTTDSACDTFLASSEVMYPGWTAYIDGRKTDILTGNLAFRSLAVPKGRHTITFSFRPISYLIGMVISSITASILLYFSIRSYFSRRSDRATSSPFP